MPVLVDAIKAAVLANHPTATVAERSANGLTMALAPLGNRERRSLDVTIGRYHYLDSGVMVPIQTDWANETGAWIDGNHASGGRILSGTTGTRRLYPRRDHMDEYIEFARPQYWTGAAWANITLPTRTRTGDTITWDTANFAISVVLTGCQVKLSVTLKTAAAAKRIRWPITLTGLTRTGWQLFSGTTVVCDIPQPTLVDAAGTERTVEAYIRNGAVEFIADVTGLTYPVVIDPTLDYQVGATANDAEAYAGSLFDSNYGDVGRVVSNVYHTFMRFTSVSGLSGATITASYVSERASDKMSLTGILSLLQADDTAAPTSPTTYATFAGKTLTTASVAWNAPAAWVTGTWYDSPSLNTVIQELATSWDPSAISIFHRDNGSTDNHAFSHSDYAANATYAAKLHIEYTAAAAGFKHYLSLLGVGR